MIDDYFEFLIDYSYHWQDKEKRLITRWDNAPHHPEIETFPHHVHEGEYIKPSEEPTFVETLKILCHPGCYTESTEYFPSVCSVCSVVSVAIIFYLEGLMVCSTLLWDIAAAAV